MSSEDTRPNLRASQRFQCASVSAAKKPVAICSHMSVSLVTQCRLVSSDSHSMDPPAQRNTTDRNLAERKETRNTSLPDFHFISLHMCLNHEIKYVQGCILGAQLHYKQILMAIDENSEIREARNESCFLLLDK